MSVSSALWPPSEEATPPTADPTVLATDEPAPEVKLLTPAEIESYQAPWTTDALLSDGASVESVSESSTVWAARCTATTRDGASGSGRRAPSSLPLIEGSSARVGGAGLEVSSQPLWRIVPSSSLPLWGSVRVGVSSVALAKASSLPRCGGASEWGASSVWLGATVDVERCSVADGRSGRVPTSGAIVAASRAGTAEIAEIAEAGPGDSVTGGGLEADTRGEGAIGALDIISVCRLSVDARRCRAGGGAGDESVTGSGVDAALSCTDGAGALTERLPPLASSAAGRRASGNSNRGASPVSTGGVRAAPSEDALVRTPDERSAGASAITGRSFGALCTGGMSIGAVAAGGRSIGRRCPRDTSIRS